MKKVVVILQIIGIIAVCPVYVALEINHASKASGTGSKTKTEERSNVDFSNTREKNEHPDLIAR